MGSGLVSLYMRGMLTGGPLAVSKNWLAKEATNARTSSIQKIRKYSQYNWPCDKWMPNREVQNLRKYNQDTFISFSSLFAWPSTSSTMTGGNESRCLCLIPDPGGRWAGEQEEGEVPHKGKGMKQ